MAIKKPSSKGIDQLNNDINELPDKKSKIDTVDKNSNKNESLDTNDLDKDTGGDLDNIDGDNANSNNLGDLSNLNGDLGGDLNNQNSPETELNSSLSLTELGRVYTLNRIKSTLNSISGYIDDAMYVYIDDKTLMNLKNQISDLNDKFILVLNNLDKYLDKLEYIIELYSDYVTTLSKYLSENYKLE